MLNIINVLNGKNNEKRSNLKMMSKIKRLFNPKTNTWNYMIIFCYAHIVLC